MCNYEPSAGISQGYFLNNLFPQEGNISRSNSINRYVYVKQNFINPSPVEQKTVMSKVLVNPHFNKTVFVNPNFNINTSLATTSVPKIHVYPRIQKLNVDDCASVQKIHINPNVLRNIPVTLNNLSKPENGTSEVRRNYEPVKDANSSVFCTKTELIHSPVKCTTVENKSRKRRSSVRSKFKIIKSSILENSLNNKSIERRRASLRSRYKIIKSTCTSENGPRTSSKNHEPLVSKFKVDNRNSNKASALQHRNRKYVYINRFLSISDIARTKLLKQNMGIKKLSLINISGILYKKSPNSLKITSGSYKKMDDIKKAEECAPIRSKFKFIKKSPNKKPNENTPLKQYKVLRVKMIKKMSLGKLRKCNIPCPYYRKFGKCKGKENGKCYRKHDPDQIALCTKFLQGACIDKKCLLSHNVSPEKMPTCKFYLEGSCSRDDCPYLHVRISPKADICKDFLEGFCKKASQCDKRHQFLCPDYEKNDTCLKQRCPYPHGKMVRKYSVLSKNKFAKKSSVECKKETKGYDKSKENEVLISTDPASSNSENLKSNNFEINFKSRYYIEQNITVCEDESQEASTSDQNNSNNDEINCDQEINSGIRPRPKLGKLPSFIAFEEVQ